MTLPLLMELELVYQMTDLDAKLIFVHPDLVPVALEGAAKSNIPKSRIYSFSDEFHEPIQGVKDWRTMIGTEEQGATWNWIKLSPEESKNEVATINFSSGYGCICTWGIS
jgi:4-coumarate--CoA ligase